MHAEPTAELVGLLERLGLASADRVRSVRSRVAGLARDLPLFESVWVDALLQCRVLTPYQAAEINAGRGEALAIGPYVIGRRIGSAGYADWFLARHRDSGARVRLALASACAERFSERLQALGELARMAGVAEIGSLAPVTDAGGDQGRLWAACRYEPGPTAAEWLVRNGRFPAEAVLDIARQIAIALRALESLGMVHGDLAAANAVLADRGDVVLSQPGLRQILRPEEGPSRADLQPEAYDYLAPERVANGSPPNTASEIFACGCLWWHLLTGRPPFAGGDALTKLRMAQEAKISDVRLLAPDAPRVLADAIAAAVQRDPRSRPQSMRQLAEMLGPPSRHGREVLRRCLAGLSGDAAAWAMPARAVRRWQESAVWLSVTGGCLVAAVALGWSLWQAAAANQPQLRSVNDAREAALPSHAPAATAIETPVETVVAGVGPAGAGPLALPGQERPVADRTVKPAPDEAGRRKNELVLPCDSPVALEAEHIQPGHTVRGEAGKRPMVVVAGAALTLLQENVRFENVDFVWKADPQSAPTRPAIIEVRASRVAFQGCSFQSAQPGRPLPAAIAWKWPIDPGEAERSLPSAEIRIGDCVFRHVMTGVACEARGALAFRFDNSIYLGRGPLLELGHYPRVDEPVVVRLDRVTLRESGPLVHCPWRPGEQPGVVSIAAEGCVFAPADRTALVRIASSRVPEELLGRIRWSGQGSLLSPDAAVIHWQDREGRVHPVDDAAMSIDGLVRSEVEFAGPFGPSPASSRVTGWQGPLQSSAAPGAVPERLPEPRG
ncbi:MAG: protein kinase [Pirellulales bacterium]|nr:protein kinase [Pirellulales bacterium]